jgi:hypothetical protein
VPYSRVSRFHIPTPARRCVAARSYRIASERGSSNHTCHIGWWEAAGRERLPVRACAGQTGAMPTQGSCQTGFALGRSAAMRAYLVQCPIICQIVEVWRSLDWVPAHRGRVSRRTRMQHCGKMASAAQTRLQTDASWRDVHRGSAAVTAHVLMITMHSVVPAGQLPYA